MARHRLPRGTRRHRVVRTNGVWTVQPRPVPVSARLAGLAVEAASVALYSFAMTILGAALAVALLGVA